MNLPNEPDGFLPPDEYLRRMKEGSEPARGQNTDALFSSPDAIKDVLSSIAPSTPVNPTSPTDPHTQKEAELSAQIESIESDFFTFEQKLISELSPNDERLDSIGVPFDIMRNNQSNKMRNSAVIERLANQKGVPVPLLALESLEDNHHFSYGPMPANAAQGHMLYAGFAPTHQMIAFQENPNMNDLDNLVLHHELRHVGHYASLRKEMGDEKYFQLIFARHEKPYSFIEHELDAYGQEIEALNILMGGKLAALKSNGLQAMNETLGLRTDQELTAKFLTLMSDAYFAPKQEGQQYSREFEHFIMQTQLCDGFKIYSLRDGRVCELQQ